MPFPYPFAMPLGANPAVSPPVIATPNIPQPQARVAPANYLGADISIIGDLNFVSVGGIQNLSQAILRRWQTPRGGLFYDANYGTDLRDWIHAVGNPAQQSQLAGLAEAEALKDERVYSCFASVAYSTTGGPPSFNITAQLTSTNGPFGLVANVSSIGVSLLRVTP